MTTLFGVLYRDGLFKEGKKTLEDLHLHWHEVSINQKHSRQLNFCPEFIKLIFRMKEIPHNLSNGLILNLSLA